MKKVMRSPILKGIAFALCLVCVAAATLTAGNALQWFYEQSERRGSNIYQLESNFEDSKMLNSSFVTAFGIIDNALQNETTQEMLDRYLEQNFFGDYYAKLGDKVLKNAELTEGDTMDSPYYMVIKPGEYQGNIQLSFVFYERWANPYEYDYYVHPDETTVTAERRPAMQEGDCILLRLTQEQADSLQAEWLEGQRVFDHALMLVIILFFLALIAYIYLLFVTGRRAEDEEVHVVLIDRLYVECNLAIILGAAIGTAVLVVVGIDEALSSGVSFRMMTYLLTALLVCAFALVMELILSLVRNLKNHTFVERSFILRAVRWCWRTVGRIVRWTIDLCKKFWHFIGRGQRGFWRNLWRKLFQDYKTRNVLLILLVYSAVLAVLGMMFGVMIDYGTALFVCLLGVLWFLLAVAFLIKQLDGFDRVVDALKRLRAGELTYKLADMPAGVLSSMAEDINSLGDGMQAAIQSEVRAERMKSELITNVSHDLKTPLTSILSYSDLLCQEHLTPEEANDYAKIIHQKSLRLKNLTSDLFDISKVQSGAEQMQCERIDACTLVRQALGEQDNAIAESRLTLKVNIPEHEVPIWADGKKMSRVMENLIGNCIKYAMPGTRVFVTVSEQESEAGIELKNIANYEMDFDAGEITERFVRGDAARTTEGSGLGLAIAKSYVEACGGALSVDVDGDLFKVRITFPVYGVQPA
ncbi:MAG: HAMP domain-containing histidine kinase [Clostridiaceae bacterium]|nr:HAMP domain-containing histidine kinase [Clostridiaceae bacterium]